MCIKEFLKCQQDFSYFAEKHLKIEHPLKGKINFNLYDYQKRLVETFENNQNVIGTKFRQGGFTTTIALYGLWKCLFNQNQSFLFVSQKDRESIFKSNLINFAIENLPENLNSLVTFRNNHKIEFKHTNSKMEFCTPIQVIGRSANHLIIDEAAFIRDIAETCGFCLNNTKKCLVISTPNGKNNWFEKTYNLAKSFKNSFTSFDCSYKEHPEYRTEKFIETTKKNLGERGWLQEFECQFLDQYTSPENDFKQKIKILLEDKNINIQEIVQKVNREYVNFLESQ